MNDRETDHAGAWADFIANVFPSLDLTRAERNRIMQVKRDATAGRVRSKRIETFLARHAPKRYEFKTVVIIHEK